MNDDIYLKAIKNFRYGCDRIAQMTDEMNKLVRFSVDALGDIEYFSNYISTTGKVEWKNLKVRFFTEKDWLEPVQMVKHLGFHVVRLEDFSTQNDRSKYIVLHLSFEIKKD